MKRLIVITSLLAFLFFTSLAFALELDIKSHQLPNGLKILILEDHTLPICTYFTFFKVGSRNEKPGITGISHLFEHMMFNGAKRYGPKEFDRILESNGGVSNAYTTNDFTAYFEDFPSDKLELIVDLDADRLENLLLNEENLSSEREVVKEERRLRTDNSNEGKLEEELTAAAFQAHSYGWPVVGWMADLDAINREDCVNYFKTHYAVNNATVIIVGDVNTAQAVKLIEKYYGHLKPGPAIPEVVKNEPEQKGERRVLCHKEAQLPAFMTGFHVPDVQDEDIYALDVLQIILTEGESSRLYKSLVYDKQMATNVWSYYFWTIDPGLFYIYVGMKPNFTTEQAEKVLYEELEKIKNVGLGEKELQKAKNILEARLIKSMKTNNGRSNLIGTYQTLMGDYGMLTKIIDKYKAVTMEDLKKVAQEYFSERNRTVSTLVPEKTGI